MEYKFTVQKKYQKSFTLFLVLIKIINIFGTQDFEYNIYIDKHFVKFVVFGFLFLQSKHFLNFYCIWN